MRMRIIVFAAALSALPGTAFALCQSNINGGTTMSEGQCYMHNNGVAVGCHGGVLAPVGGTTNKCNAWIKVERQPAGSLGNSAVDPIQATREQTFSSNPSLQEGTASQGR